MPKYGCVHLDVVSLHHLRWFFLRWRSISLLVWVICLAGTIYLFYAVPKAFLPVGDSAFAWGVFIAQEGSSPEQMHQYQKDVEEVVQADPNVDMTFTVSGFSQLLGSNQGFVLGFLNDPSKRPNMPIDRCSFILPPLLEGPCPVRTYAGCDSSP